MVFYGVGRKGLLFFSCESISFIPVLFHVFFFLVRMARSLVSAFMALHDRDTYVLGGGCTREGKSPMAGRAHWQALLLGGIRMFGFFF